MGRVPAYPPVLLTLRACRAASLLFSRVGTAALGVKSELGIGRGTRLGLAPWLVLSRDFHLPAVNIPQLILLPAADMEKWRLRQERGAGKWRDCSQIPQGLT